MPYIARTPQPPYYAVVFTSINADVDHREHVEGREIWYSHYMIRICRVEQVYGRPD